MSNAFRIDGIIEISPEFDGKVSQEDFLDTFIEMIESLDWSFGGSTWRYDEENEG